MLLSIEGEEATGKTTLAYTAPTPSVGFQFDLGSDRAIYGAKYGELFEGKKIVTVPYGKEAVPQWNGNDITIYELPTPIQLEGVRVQGALELWLYFVQLANKSLVDPGVASIIIDTMTIARKLRADAYLQTLQDKAFTPDGKRRQNIEVREQLIQIEWGKPNGSIRDLYIAGGGARKNLAAVHHLTDERMDKMVESRMERGVLTGNRILDGLSDTYRFVDVAVRTTTKGQMVSCTVLKCGYALSIKGTSLENPTWESLTNTINMATGGRLHL